MELFLIILSVALGLLIVLLIMSNRNMRLEIRLFQQRYDELQVLYARQNIICKTWEDMYDKQKHDNAALRQENVKLKTEIIMLKHNS